MLQWQAGTDSAPDQMTLLNPVASVKDDAPGGGRVEVKGLRLSGKNPGGAPAEFEVTLAGDQSARLDVYDMQGRRVQTLSSGLTTAGRHRLSWDGRDARGGRAACGVYFARLGWTGGQTVARLVLVR
jgi:flagellar hook assembly protein FlgD